MKRFAILFSVLALIATSCVCCTKDTLPADESCVKTDYIYADAKSAPDILKLLEKSGYTVYSLDETTTTYWLTFTDFPEVVLPDGTTSRSDRCAVSKQAADSYSIEDGRAYIHLKAGSTVQFKIRTNTDLELLTAVSKASYVIEDITLANEKYTITFKEHPPVSLLRVYPDGIESIALDAEEITSVEEHAGKTLLTVSDGNVLTFKNALTKAVCVSEDDILFEEPASTVDVRFELEGFERKTDVCVTVNSDRVKAAVTMDSDGKGGTLSLTHLDDNKWITVDYTKHIPPYAPGEEPIIPTMELTEFDETYVTLTASDGKESARKSIRTMYDDLILNHEKISAVCWDMGYGKQLNDTALVMSKLGITAPEKNTWYRHVTRNRGWRSYNVETGDYTGRYNFHAGTVIKTSRKMSVDDLVIEYDHKFDGWFETEFDAESTTPTVNTCICAENDSDEIKVVTIALHRKGSKKVIYLKEHFDYRDCYEIYGMEKFNPENSFLDN